MTARIPLLNLVGYKGIEEVCESYYCPTLRFVRSFIQDDITAADLTQVTFEKVIKNIQGFEIPENEKEDDALRNWIFKIARNNIHNYNNRKNMEAAFHIGSIKDAAIYRDSELITTFPNAFKAGLSYKLEDQISPEEEYLQAEGNQKVIKCLENLGNKDMAEALQLQVLEGLSYQEISERQGVRIGTVMSRLNRGREKLKKRLEKIL